MLVTMQNKSTKSPQEAWQMTTNTSQSVGGRYNQKYLGSETK